MLADALPLVFLTAAAVLHAAWNALVKRADASGPLSVWVMSALGTPVFLALLAWWAMTHDGLGANGWAALVSTVLHTVYALALQRAYKVADLSTVYPISRGVAPVIVTIATITIVGAEVNPSVWVAVSMVLAGVFLASDLQPRANGTGVGVWHGLLVAACTAAYTLWDSHAAQGLDVDAVPYLALSGLAQALLLTFAMGRRASEMPAVLRRGWKPALPIAILAPLSYGLVYVAMQHAPPDMVATTRNLNIVFGVLIGVVFLRERLNWRGWLGTILVAAGALLASV